MESLENFELQPLDKFWKILETNLQETSNKFLKNLKRPLKRFRRKKLNRIRR